MSRLVTWECPGGHRAGYFVDDDAAGPMTLPCEHCGLDSSVDVTRSEAPIRPTNTPAQRAEWATQRSRAARALLADLVAGVEEYVRLQDLTVEELPAASPLRRAVLAARVELKKSAP